MVANTLDWAFCGRFFDRDRAFGEGRRVGVRFKAKIVKAFLNRSVCLAFDP